MGTATVEQVEERVRKLSEEEKARRKEILARWRIEHPAISDFVDRMRGVFDGDVRTNYIQVGDERIAREGYDEAALSNGVPPHIPPKKKRKKKPEPPRASDRPKTMRYVK